MAGVLFKLRKEGDGVERHANVHVGRELRAHAAHALSGGAETGMRLALENENIAAALLSEMVGDARSDDAAAYDYYVRYSHETLIVTNGQRHRLKRSLKKSQAA